MDSDLESPAKKRRYSKTNLDKCSVSRCSKSAGEVRVLKGAAASDSSTVDEDEK